MKKTIAITIAALGLGLLAVGGIASCKQEEGQRCQVTADCEDGLICNKAEGICRASEGSQGIDALPPIDAPADAM